MVKDLFGHFLTFVFSVLASYIINRFIVNRKTKRELVYDQFKSYSNKLYQVKEGWQEFDDLMDVRSHGEMADQLLVSRVFPIINKIENSYYDYRSTIHTTAQTIQNYFDKDEVEKFMHSVYVMNDSQNGDRNDEYHFLKTAKDEFLLHANGDGSELPDRNFSIHAMNAMYGTYENTYHYKVHTKLKIAQEYIDGLEKSVMNDISKYKVRDE